MRGEAIRLAGLGWRVHPVHGIVDGVCTCGSGAACRSAGKHPVLPDWTAAASAERAVVDGWDWDGRNLGVVPSGFCVLDFDGAEGRSLLARMGQLLPELPDDTPIARTGSGGYHVFVAGEAKTRTKLISGLDIRGLGGQAVLPPSRHFSGGQYTWLNPPRGPVPDAPEWLAVAQGTVPDALLPADVVTEEDLVLHIKGRLAPAIRAAVAGEPFAPRGQRNATMASLAGAIARKWPFADPFAVAALFRPSLQAMAVDDGAPTEVLLVSALQRFQERQREELKARPRIFVTTDIEGMAGEAIEALGKKALDLGVYSRGGLLTRVKPPEHLPDGVLRAELPHAFEPIVQGNLTAHLATVASWTRRKPSGDVPAYPPPAVVVRVDRRGEWPGIPHAEQLVEGQVLRPDGTIFPGGGYDPTTGTVAVGPPDHSPPVSVDEALGLLRYLVVDFPFEGPEHQSAWLASVLTAVGQQVFRGPSPLFLIDANVAGAGKTLLAELSILVASGRSPARAALGQNNDEDRKQITSLAIAGASCILIDNITGLWGTPKLCEALTSHGSSWSDRILGRSETWSGPFKPTWWATGNNIRLRPDIARRTCYIRLCSPLEQPELRRGFACPSLMAWATEHRAELYRAALSLLHHYILAGRPREDLPPWGTFEGWGETVQQCLVWCGLPDPSGTRESLTVADEEKDLLGELLSGLAALGAEPFSPSALHRLVYSAQTAEEREKLEGLREALEDGCVQRQLSPTPQSIGRLLSRFRERVSRGMKLRKLSRPGSWWVVVPAEEEES